MKGEGGTSRLVLAAVAVAVLAPAAVAGAQEWKPKLRTSEVFLRCDGNAGTVKLWNAARQEGGTIGWSPARPTQPHPGGCASVDAGSHTAPVRDPLTTLTFAGTTTGNLDSLRMKLFTSSLSPSGTSWKLDLGVKVDGVDVVAWPTAVSTTATDINSNFNNVLEIGVAGIGLLKKQHAGKHDVEVTIGYRAEDRLLSWFWDSTDLPSGLVFNPTSLPETRVRPSG